MYVWPAVSNSSVFVMFTLEEFAGSRIQQEIKTKCGFLPIILHCYEFGHCDRRKYKTYCGYSVIAITHNIRQILGETLFSLSHIIA